MVFMSILDRTSYLIFMQKIISILAWIKVTLFTCSYQTSKHEGSGQVTRILRVFRVWFVLGWAGNCIRPCFHLDPRAGTFTVRFNVGNECNFYFKHGFRWNWDLIARKFGKSHEAPHGTVYFYDGILGYHADV